MVILYDRLNTDCVVEAVFPEDHWPAPPSHAFVKRGPGFPGVRPVQNMFDTVEAMRFDDRVRYMLQEEGGAEKVGKASMDPVKSGHSRGDSVGAVDGRR